MLPCVRFFVALFGFCAGLGAFWIMVGNLFYNECPQYYGRTCNDRGRCDDFGVCHCDRLFSGEACQNTGVANYLAATNEVCGGAGIVLDHGEYIYPDCVETTPSAVTGRKGGWDAPKCRNRVASAKKEVYYYETPSAEDAAGLPMCLCRPGMAGPGCTDACPRSLDQLVCSGNGNATVGLMRNGTMGEGCQCDSILSLAAVLPHLNPAQRLRLAENSRWFEGGICGRLLTVRVDDKDITVVIPARTSEYTCKCDARHFGDVCQDGVCPQTDDGVFCSGHGHKSLGFGAEANTTRAVSAFGEKGTPLCRVGANGCCVENQALCAVSELRCPASRPYRCSTTARCVGKPRVSRCDQGWAYGYWDDPAKAPRRRLVAGPNVLPSRVLAFFFRTGAETDGLRFTYEGATYEKPTSPGHSFWTGTLGRTLETDAELSFAGETSPVQVRKNGVNDVEFWPAHFLHGQAKDTYDATVRLASTYDHRAVVDVLGSRVEFIPDGEYVLANLSADSYLRPGGTVVDALTCMGDLTTCAWPADQSGAYSLCERSGRIGSVRGPRACAMPSAGFERVRTVAYGAPRVPLRQWAGDARWSLQLPAHAYSGSLVVEADPGVVWAGEVLLLDDARVPCVCEPSPRPGAKNASVWDAQWAREATRPTAVQGGPALARVETWGDARWVRGELISASVVLDQYGETHAGVTGSKALTREESKRGVPSPPDAVYPHRCPDGRGAKTLTHELRAVPGSANCTALGASVTCDNGCKCTPRRCTCPESESEGPVHAAVSAKVWNATSECWITRPGRANWTRTSRGCIQSSQFNAPLEFRTASNQTVSGLRARFYGGAWFDVGFEAVDASVYPMITDATEPFDEWCLFLLDGQEAELESAEFLPTGVSAYRVSSPYAFRASEALEDAPNVVWNDGSVWSTADRGYLRVDFPTRAVRLVGVFVVFETMGLYVDSSFGALNATLSLHVGPIDARDDFRVDWEWAADVSGKTVNSTDVRYVEFPTRPLAQSVRIVSRFPMSIRRFVPVTDQICESGILTPADAYPEDVVIRATTEQRRLDPNATRCVSDDSCVLLGVPAGRDGACADYKHATWGLEPTESFELAANLSAQGVVVFMGGNASLEAQTACWGACCAWGSGLPSARPDGCSSGNLTWTGNFAFGETPDPPFYVQYNRKLTWGANLVEGVNTCANGTDYSDCGASSRLDRTSPGLACEPSGLELAFLNRNVSARSFDTSAPVTELLGMGMRLDFTVAYVRDVTVLGRGPCGDCDGRHRCGDGVCVDHAAQCMPTRYSTPGDGCVRVDPSRKAYKCACEVGWSGFACDKGPCVALDPNTGEGDPHEWCTCGGANDRKFSKIRVKPPFTYQVKPEGYTRKDVLRMNRARPRTSDRDVGWENVKFTEAPWGVAVKRQFMRRGVVKYSNCPYLARTPTGRLVDLEECVESRSDAWPHEVTKWREWPMGNGSMVTIAWDGPWFETKYDAAPYRCGSTCVADERECYRNNLVNPPCGGRGECRADGSCACGTGWETFVLTDRLSRAVAVPYASKDGVSDPTAWGTPDPIRYDAAVCRARACATVDCTPPYGCFVGTLALEFADRNVTCEASSGHGGMCALDAAACRRGDVAPPLPCSGNGILRKKDYRDEWYCECGSPRSPAISDASQVRETSELVPNGFGGPRCNQYFCQDDASLIWLQRVDPRTDRPYVGSDGIDLPYKWRGPCDAPVGPKPEDMGLWRQCCDKKRLDQCERVPCLRGRTDKKFLTCEEPHLCLDATSQPLVYPCNGHGKPLADGTCACDVTDAEGYTYDESVWSGKGCIRRSQCDVAKSSGTMCNKKRDCAADFKAWSELPRIPYFEQQWPTLLLRAGLPPTNRTFVDLVFRDDGPERQRYVASQLGQNVEDAIDAASASICVVPNDDPSNPFGMVAYDPETTCAYGDGYDAPRLIRNPSVLYRPTSEFLFDGAFGAGSLREGVDYVRLTRDASSADADAGVSLVVHLGRPTFVRAIRVHARIGYQASGPAPQLEVLDADLNLPVCPTPPALRSEFAWMGSQNAWYCVPTYHAFNFRTDDLLPFFKTNCHPDESSAKCVAWKDATCLARGYEVNPPGAFAKILPGCAETSRCCVADRALSYDPVTRLSLRLPASPHSRAIDVDEIQVFGTYAKGSGVETVPAGMRNWIRHAIGGADTQCRDGVLLTSAFGGQSLTAYVARDWSQGWVRTPEPMDQLDFAEAALACEDTGGRLGSNRAPSSEEAEVLGRACFSNSAGSVPCWVNARDRNMPLSLPVDGSTADHIHPYCAAWGCWTPNPLDPLRDYVATPWNDTAGVRLWKQEWCAGCVPWTKMMGRLYAEVARQKDLVMGTTLNVGKWPTKFMNRRKTIYWWGEGFAYLNEPNYNEPWFWHTLYRPTQARVGNGYGVDPPEVTDRATLGTTAVLWTNPQTCVVTLYSESLCGRFFAEFDGGAKRVFVFSPSNNYGGVTMNENLAWYSFNECVSGASSCAKLGDLIMRNVRSISIQGPCMITLDWLVGPGYEGQKYYIPRDRHDALAAVHFFDVTSMNLRVAGYSGPQRFMDPDRLWLDGCYPQFDQQPPFHAHVMMCGIVQGTCRVGMPSSLLGGQGVGEGGMDPLTVVGVQVYPRFNSRRLEVDLRTFPTESPNLDQSDYYLGHQDHARMCTRMRVVETRRIFAGMRPPESTTVDRSIPGPVRWVEPSGERRHRVWEYTTVGSASAPYLSRAQTFLEGYAGFAESLDAIYDFTEDEMRNGVTKGADSTLVHGMVPCESLGRTILQCNACPTPRSASWEWNQLFFNPENAAFQAKLTSQIPAPTLHVSWNSSSSPSVQRRVPLASLERKSPAAFARLSASFRAEHFNRPHERVAQLAPGFYYDACLSVNRTSDVAFAFQPALCMNDMRAACVLDYTRFAVQSGCQCDECGPDSRSVPLAPNSTVFDLFPLARRDLYPEDHAVRDAWKAGQLATFFQEQPLPVDAIVRYLGATNQAFIHAMPGFYEAFWGAVSDRASFLSPGQIANPTSWIDFDFARAFPHSCGTVYSRFTGEGRPMCAKAPEFCNRDRVFPTTPMNAEDYPTGLRALSPLEDERASVQCGRVVSPWDLIRPTEDEPPSPKNGLFLLLDSGAESITIRTIVRNSGFVRNTYRDVDVIKPGSVLRGTVSCSEPCAVRVWVGSLNPNFLDSERRLDVGETTGGTYAFSVTREADLSYRTLGWDVISAPSRTVIKISSVLITDDDSIAECRRDRARNWVEPPPNVDSPAPQHRCVFTDREAALLKTRDVGVCYCSPASPYGGPTCEWPATVSKHGKRVCNAFAGVRTGKSKALAPTGELVTANEFGVFEYGASGEFGCKTRSDVGSAVRARMVQGSMSDFRYVVKTTARPNEEEFTVRTEAELGELLFNFPVRAESVSDVCDAFSSTLPSFTTADEIGSYLALGVSGAFLDMSETAWLVRGEALRVNSTSAVHDPCDGGTPGVCRALNFNNYLLNVTSTSFLNDGRSALGVVPSATNLRVRPDLTPRSQMTVAVYGCDDASMLTVRASNDSTTFYDCTALASNSSSCALATPITTIRVSALTGGIHAAEVMAFWALDAARPIAAF